MKTLIRPLKWSCAALLAVALPAVAQTTDTWSGAADANWSTAGNWTPGVPSAGDNLIFDGSVQTSPNNDLTVDTLIGGINFAPTAAAFTLGGNRVLLQGTVENDATNQLQTIAQALVLTNTVTFNTVSNDLNQVSGNDIAVIGNITGPGALVKTGAGTLTLSSALHTGGTTVAQGVLVVSNNIGNVSLGGGTYIMNFRSYYINPTISLTADSSIGVDVLDNTEPVGVDIYSTIGTVGYKLTKVGLGLIRMNGSINASSIDVAEGTLGSLGGGIGGAVSVEPVHKLGTAPITVENGAMLRVDDGGVVQNAITLNGTGTATGGSANTGALRSSSRNNGGSITNFNYFTNTITLASDSTIGTYYNTTYISGNITGPAGFTKIGGSPLNISGSNDFAGAVNINAGTLQLGSSNAIPTASAVTLNGNSTLDLNGNSPSLAGGLYDDASGSGNVDNSSANPVTVSLNSATLKSAFKNTGGGPLSIANVTGSTTLTGANSFSGGIAVQSGSLEIYIPNSSSNGLVSVADGATLALDFQAPGGSMKPNGVTLAGAGTGVTLNFNLNFYGTSSKPILNATNGSGILTANGITTITFVNPGNLNVGQYPLIKYKTRAGTGNFVLTTIPGIGATIVTNASNNSIDLKVTSAPIVTWKGKTNNNLWDTTTTNWTYNSSAVLYADGIPIYFDDTALTNNVNLTTALNPGSVLVNTTNTYTFGGAGSLNGGILTKNGTGTLVVDVSGNGYASTLISGGTLQVGNNDTFGDLGGNAVDDEATLAFNRSDNFTFGNLISGAGAVIQNNTNTTTLSVANTYTGGTLISQGVLKLGLSNCLGAPVSSPLATVASGASMDLNGKWGSYPLYVVISGTGSTAGRGALFTTAGMGCTIGCNPVSARFVRLAGDATIGDSSGDFQLGADHNANPGENGLVGSLDGQNHALTKIGNNTVIIEVTNASPLSAFNLAQGGAIICATATTPFGPNCPIVISNNAIMDTWSQGAQGGITFANNFTIGTGGATVRNTHGSYGGNEFDNYNGSFTLNDTLWLTCNYKNGSTPGQININGPISGTGGINNNGSYAVSLTGLNTYTGPTVATNNNSLRLSTRQQGGGSCLIYDNSTLDVPLQTGYNTVPMSTLMIGSSTGGNLSFSRISSFSTSNAPVTATNLTLLGTSTVLLSPAVYGTPGQFPLIKYTSLSGTIANLALGRGTPAYLSNNVANSSIDLVVPGGNPVTWVGNLNNLWDINNNSNFKYLGATTTYLQPGSLGDAVTFDDSSAVTNVNISVPVSPSSVLANLTNNTYIFAGTNITGAGSLVKNGPGTLVLSNLNNNFSGGTLINGGTLKMATSLSPFVALNNLTGTATVNSGATLDMGSNNPTALTVNISGSGVGGNGALQANYSGGAVAWGPSAVNLLANATIGGNNRWDLRSGSKTLTAANPNTSLTKVGSALIALVGVTVSTNIGDVAILGGQLGYQTSTTGLGSTNNTLYIGSSGQLELYQASVPLVKNIVCTNGAKIFAESGNTLGQNVLAGPITLVSGSTQFRANYSFSGMYVSNVISGAGGFSMEGQNYVYLAASNTFTGQLSVNDCNNSNGGRGTRLSFIGNGSAMTCSQIYLQGIVSGQAYAAWISMDTPSATLTLGTNQQLRGDNGAYVRGSVVAPAGSSLAVGPAGNTNYQYMIIGTNLTLQAGSTNYMEIYKTATLTTNSQLYVTNALALGGTLVIGTNGALAPLVAGDSFKLYFAGSVAGSFANITPSPGAGLIWDSSQLATSGTLSVKAIGITPASTNVVYGNNVQLTASTTSGGTLTYQWYDKNTNAISGATNATLTLVKPSVAASGNYTVAVTNGSTLAGSAVAQVTVTPASLSITATNISKNFGTTYTFAGTEFVSSGLLVGDSITSVSLASAGAASGAAVNTYPIVPSSAVGSGLANYNIAYNNGTMTVVQTVNLGRTNIVTSVNGNTLTMSWPADHIGWTLQSNSVGLANSGAWFDVPGSSTTNQVNILFDPTKPNVFYRMKY